MIIFTASHQSYADSVLDHIDPMREYFKVRLYRQHCIKLVLDTGEAYIKDLRVIRNIDLNNTVIIDNSVLSFSFQLNNGIPVLPFYNNKNDNELIYLKDYLLELFKSDSILTTNQKVFNLKGLINERFTSSEDSEAELKELSINKIKAKNKSSSVNFDLDYFGKEVKKVEVKKIVQDNKEKDMIPQLKDNEKINIEKNDSEKLQGKLEKHFILPSKKPNNTLHKLLNMPVKKKFI